MSGQHHLANALVDLHGDRATAETEFLAVNVERDAPGTARVQHSGGRYLDDLVRTGDGWRIARRALLRKNDEAHAVGLDDARAALLAPAAANPAVAGL